MTQRNIDDSFWGWDDVQELTPAAKLLYLYSWTNQHSNLAACYHITLKTICFETGLTINQVKKSLSELKDKINYSNKHGYLWVRNFIKHQPGKSSESFLKNINKLLSKMPQDVALTLYEYNLCVSGFSEIVDKPTANDRWVPSGTPEGTDSTNTSTSSYTNTKELNIDFEKFWNLYPRRNGKRLEKPKAKEWFKKNVTSKDLGDLLAATENYTNSSYAESGHTKDAFRWLPNWKDWLEPETNSNETDWDGMADRLEAKMKGKNGN